MKSILNRLVENKANHITLLCYYMLNVSVVSMGAVSHRINAFNYISLTLYGFSSASKQDRISHKKLSFLIIIIIELFQWLEPFIN